MAAVPAVLLDSLAASRRAGADFADAWRPAIAAALRAAPRGERDEWETVLAETAEPWRAAFECEPAQRRESALQLVGEDRTPQVLGECERCGGDVPTERGRKGRPARYCSRSCSNLAGSAAAKARARAERQRLAA